MKLFQLQRTRYAGLVISVFVMCLMLGSGKQVYAEGYPGKCTFENAWGVNWDLTPGKHVFPTEQDPFTSVICQPTRSIDSTGQYTPKNLTCEYKTVTSGEYWCLWPTSGRSIAMNYYDEDNGWIESDRFSLSHNCELFPPCYRCVYLSNEDRIHLDSLPFELPPGCSAPKELNLGKPCE